MKLISKFLISSCLLASPVMLQAQNIGDLLKGLGNSGGGVTDVIGNVIEGVFTKSDLTLTDLVGNYVSEGPAISFKSDNFLQKAGGLAGSATIESKLTPYYQQYGLTGMTLSIDENANFNMKVKGISLSGIITKNDGDGTFDFNLSVAGVKLGKFTAYIEKSGSSLKVMFDGTKLKDIISAVAKFTGNSMASALGSILESYDGAYIGFKMKSTGNTTSESSTSTSDSSSSVANGVNALKNILKNGK